MKTISIVSVNTANGNLIVSAFESIEEARNEAALAWKKNYPESINVAIDTNNGDEAEAIAELIEWSEAALGAPIVISEIVIGQSEWAE